jgi:hypothetical protein
MTRLRFTIGTLVLVVAVAAVGLAAIHSGSAAWAGAMLSITVFAMICSLLGIALGRAMRRVYWTGFAILGWSYLLLMYVPWLSDNIGQNLLAPNLFAYLDEVLHAATLPGGGSSVGMQSIPVELIGASATGGGFGGAPFTGGAASEFQRIGMAIEALLWAFLGGWSACYFASGREGSFSREPAAEPRTTTETSQAPA